MADNGTAPMNETTRLAASRSSGAVREALENIRTAILEAPIEVVTDTLWMPERLSKNETVVDYIDAALASQPPSSDASLRGALEQIKCVCIDNANVERKDLALRFIHNVAVRAIDALVPADGVQPTTRDDLRRFVDIVWNEATESTAVPSTKWADRLIATALAQTEGGKSQPFAETKEEADELADNGRNTGGKSYYRSSEAIPAPADERAQAFGAILKNEAARLRNVADEFDPPADDAAVAKSKRYWEMMYTDLLVRVDAGEFAHPARAVDIEATIVTCCVTGAIPGDGGACGDCDPCIMGEASVPDAVKRLIAEKNSLIQRVGELEEKLIADVEEIARAISLSYGEEPDDMASILDICTDKNQPLPNWKKYEEQAEAILASLPGMNEEAIRVEERERCAAEIEGRNWPCVGDARRIAADLRTLKTERQS